MPARSLSLCWRLLAAVAAAFLGSSRMRAQGLALHAGESFTYRVNWGFLPSVGRIVIAAEAAQLDGRSVLRVITTTATRGIVREFFPFDARGESVFDAKTGRLLSSEETSESRRKSTKTSMVINYPKRTARFTDYIEPVHSRNLKMPPGDPFDLILGLVQTRAWVMKPGESRDALVIFDDQFYALTIHAEGYEDVDTPLGTSRTLVLAPQMDKTPPKGIFKHGSTVRVWIAQDGRRLPVRFEVELQFGVCIATLVDYHPPNP